MTDHHFLIPHDVLQSFLVHNLAQPAWVIINFFTRLIKELLNSYQKEFFLFMRGSSHIRSVLIGVEYRNFRRTLDVYFFQQLHLENKGKKRLIILSLLHIHIFSIRIFNALIHRISIISFRIRHQIILLHICKKWTTFPINDSMSRLVVLNDFQLQNSHIWKGKLFIDNF